MTSKNLIEDYDNYMNNLFSFLNDKEVKTLPKPSSNLSIFKIEMIGWLKLNRLIKLLLNFHELSAYI